MGTLLHADTPFGRVFRLDGGCRDDWRNVVTSKYYRKPSGTIRRRRRVQAITLQGPAMASLRAVEEAIGREVVVTGSSRTCEYQAALYAKDPARYAPPWVGLHCQQLAIDVNTTWQDGLTPTTEERFREAMRRKGWTRARPVDEPWHWSFGWTA